METLIGILKWIFDGNLEENYEWNFDGIFAGNFDKNFDGNFDGNFDENFHGNFDDNNDGNFNGNFDGSFDGNFDDGFNRMALWQCDCLLFLVTKSESQKVRPGDLVVPDPYIVVKEIKSSNIYVKSSHI